MPLINSSDAHVLAPRRGVDIVVSGFYLTGRPALEFQNAPTVTHEPRISSRQPIYGPDLLPN